MAYWTPVPAAEADVTALAANPGAMIHYGINAMPTTGTFHLDAWWERGTADAGVRSVLIPADGEIFGLGVRIQSAVGGANTIDWTVDVDSGAGFAGTDITIESHATDSTGYVTNTSDVVAVSAGDLVRCRGVITGTLNSGALFIVAHLRFRAT